MEGEEKKYLIALSHFKKFGPARLRRIKNHFRSYKNAFQADSHQFRQAGIEEAVACDFIRARPKLEPDRLIEALDREKIKTVAWGDRTYPKLLLQIHNPPQLLYFKGEFDQKDEFSLAVVGTRRCSAYGRQITRDLVRPLSACGLTVVSGLAYGIDTLAHNSALEKSGRTVAVLGSGLDKACIYPASNRHLADKIVAAGGLIISEFPPGTAPLKLNFPQRNRILSGLCLGTLVVEAGKKSGALITARYSLEQNREVLAVPGNVNSPVSAGPNLLIQQGATPVTKAEDIFRSLNITPVPSMIESRKILPETEEEKILLKHLTKEPAHINQLIRLTNLDTAVISSTLIIMEMKGMVRNLGNMRYVLAG